MKHNWQGIVYMMLDAGFPHILALQDSISAGKFSLSLSLLSKIKDDEVVRTKNSSNMNLLHYLAAVVGGSPSIALAQKLLERGVSKWDKDNTGSVCHRHITSPSSPPKKLIIARSITPVCRW